MAKAVDELTKRPSRHKQKAAETIAPPKSSKPGTQVRKPQVQVFDGSNANGSPWTPPFSVKFECDRCLAKGIECKTHPTRPCKHCQYSKLRCSLMPQNSRTGKTIRQLLTAKYVFEYRLEQHNDKMKSNLSSQLVGQRGKKVVRTQQEDLQPEVSGFGLSESEDDSPAPLPASATGSSIESIQALSSTEVPLPPSSRIVVPVPPIQIPQQQSPTATSQSSNDGQNLTARVTALEENWKEFAAWKERDRQNLTARVTALEETINRWEKELAEWKEDIDCKLEDDEL